MKIKALVEEIHKILSGGQSEDSRYSYNEIFVHINQVAYTLAKNSFYENSKLEGLSFANECFHVKVSVNITDEDGEKYLLLPVLPISLPKNRGLISIASNGLSYYSIIQRHEFIYRDSHDYPNQVMYYLTGSKIKLLPTIGTTLPSSVKVVLVSPYVETMESESPYPKDIEAEIIKQVVNILSIEKKSPQDIINDGNDLS